MNEDSPKDRMLGNKPGMVGGVTSKQAEKSQRNFEKYMGGKKITREEALEGLGDPETWAADAKRIYKEFRMKPSDKVRQELKDEFDLGSI